MNKPNGQPGDHLRWLDQPLPGVTGLTELVAARPHVDDPTVTDLLMRGGNLIALYRRDGSVERVTL